jgi:Outer membrane protein beta-barrel domain
MRSSLLVLGLSLALPFAAPAAAGPYVGVGIGTAPTLGDGMPGFAPTSRSGRLELGTRFSAVAVEGGVGGFQLVGARASQYDAVSVNGGAKIFFNLQGPLDAFVRGGLQRTWLSTDSAMADYTGDGFYLGGGVELRLALPLGSTAIWMDYTHHQATLHSETRPLESTAGMWTVGLSVGL